MCWNAKASFTTFIIGTLLNLWNVYHFSGDKTILVISLVWQWILLIQLFEGIAWLNQPSNLSKDKCNDYNNFAAKGAYISNILQPIFFAVVALAFLKTLSYNTKSIVISLVLIYIVWLIYSINKANLKVNCLTPTKECSNLQFSWWKEMYGGAVPYIILFILLFLLLIKPFNFAVYNLIYLGITFSLSAYFYKCGIGSVWCWFAALAPLFVGYMYKIS